MAGPTTYDLLADVRVSTYGEDCHFKNVRYYGSPRFIVTTQTYTGMIEERFGIYSPDLYQSLVPKGGCNGTIFGEWETNHGRMRFEPVGNLGFKGTFAENNGTFTGHFSVASGVQRGMPFVGDWEGSLGRGSFVFDFSTESANYFSGRWSRGDAVGSLERAGKASPASACHRI
jgi:hypothetical protein